MDTVTLTTEIRSTRGKGANRQLRVAERIPGVLYGPGVEPTALTLLPKELSSALSTQYGRNILLKVDVNGEHLAMVKELQIHPVTRQVLHVDLYKVDPTAPVDAKVPFRAEGRAKGVVAGGELKVTVRDVAVRCSPDKIPAEIVVDITELDLDEAIKVKDLKLPEGVEALLDPERSLVTVMVAKQRPSEDEEADEAAADTEAPS